jgi:hypothetical protein
VACVATACGWRTNTRFASLCDGFKRHYAGVVCMSRYGPSIEEVVVQAFFDALCPAPLDALQALLAQRTKEEERLPQYHRDQVRRATYEAHLARRRYEAVDPDNRLVAASLEKGWEEKLVAWRKKKPNESRIVLPDHP